MKKLLSLFLICVFLTGVNIHCSESVADCMDGVVSYAISEGESIISSSESVGIFPIASLSKLFTAALVLKLEEEGELSLDDRVFEILPEFSLNDERYIDITVEMLLNHTSGLMGSTMKNAVLYNEADSYNHDDFLNLIKAQRLKYTPGTMANYTNDGYTLLELIIEKVTKKSYTEYLHEVFDGFVPGDKIKTSSELTSFQEEVINANASCGIYSDAETVCKVLYKVFLSEEIISKEASLKMIKARDGALPGENFGLGIDCVSVYPFDAYGIKAVAKRGDGVYHHSAFLYLPEYEICATFIIKGGDSRIAETKAVAAVINYLKEKHGIEVEYYNFEKDFDVKGYNIEKIKKYEGIYMSSFGQYKFRTEDNSAILTDLMSGENTRLSYIGDGKFDIGDGVLYFSEFSDNVYMITEGITETGEGKSRYFDYYAVKIKFFGTNNSDWLTRKDNLYFLCDEKYNSLMYNQGLPYVHIGINTSVPGFIGYRKISDSDTAISDIVIPGSSGADLSDIKVYFINDKEYISNRSRTYLNAVNVPDIYNGEKSVCTILSDGYTRWFRAGEAKEKDISVDIIGKGAFYIYNNEGECLYSSLTEKGKSIIPEGGYIAFSGDTGTVFEITLAYK